MSLTRIRRAPAALAALALAVGLAACASSGASATPPASQSQPPAQSQAPQSAAPAESGGPLAGGCPTSPPEPLPAGETREVTIETELGNIVIGVEADLGPLAAGNFVALAQCGFYDGVVFHRIMPDFVIQGGDPTGTGSGGPGYEFPNDPVSVPYQRGVVAMANAGRDTNGSQFFIVLAEAGLPPDYSVFGRVTSGMEVADEISAGPSTGGQAGQALEPVTMNRVTVATP
ncbi:MAG TPA: peptidylprolyl isomerase [Candidatus Limnocylindrales bacterium]|nr:peptidylprolyl isomerase [Candidatus Limnocylindrales bacterium]